MIIMEGKGKKSVEKIKQEEEVQGQRWKGGTKVVKLDGKKSTRLKQGCVCRGSAHTGA